MRMEEVLKVKMLGNFSMEYQGRIISIERNERTKTNQLLQLLLYFRDGLPREQLLHELFMNEQVVDPANSLRALVFRLRKCLREQNLPGKEFVTIEKHIYRFTPDLKIECDVHKFEEAAEQALDETEENLRYKRLEEACESYSGEFLPKLVEAEWAELLNVKCQNLYCSCMKEFCESSIAKKEYKKLYRAASRAVLLYPFDGWQSYQMEALVALNHTKEAQQLYEETERMMLEELGGAALPEQMITLMKKLGSRVENKTDAMEEVLENIREKGEITGTYKMSFLNFVESARLISRVIERTKQTAWLLLCTITDGKGYALEDGERLEELREELGEAIAKALRRGDLYTQYSNNQYLILLLEMKKENCQSVIERINMKLKQPSRKKYIQYQLAPLKPAGRDIENTRKL